MAALVDSVGTRDAYEQRVLDVVREVALEVGGPRALQAVTRTASLEREVGLGSLERVELLMRLETALACELDDRFLLMDSVREIAAAALQVAATGGHRELPPVAIPAAAPATRLDLNALASVADALWLRADADPARVHVSLLENHATRDVSFGELRDGAAAIATGLADYGVGMGQSVAIMLPTGFDFLQSFMGSMAGGFVPVPLYPPARLDRMQEYLLRQRKILANSGSRVLITVPEAAPVAERLRREVPTLRGIVTAGALRHRASAAPPRGRPMAAVGDLALIQYTSGSTGDPKGVCLTHANLLANIRAIASVIDMRPTDFAVSWLPLYHDMGLIGTWLSSIVHGVPLALMSPLSFLARPERWLWAIHQRRATLSAAPNFAFELCLRKLHDETLEGLDLSSWRCALNGSEPVSAATVERFVSRFGRFGFRPNAMMPVYGLAECAVGLTFPPPDRPVVIERVMRELFQREGRATVAATGDRHALRFVSVGRALPGHEVRLIDDHGADVPERTIGRLIFRGPSAMTHYHENPVATAKAVRPGGWIDSGDLAYRASGELFITGRAKDLIIKGGRNIVPQEIEELAAGVDGVRKGCVAAFGVPNETTGTEQLIVVAESTATDEGARQRLEAAIIDRVAASTGLPPDAVVIVAPGVVPKTPSGKLRRAATRDLYVDGRLRSSTRAPISLRLRLLRGMIATTLRRTLARAGRWLYAAYLAVAGAVLVVAVGIPVRVLLALLPGRRPAFVLARFAARVALRTAGCRVSVEGLAHLSRRGPLVLVSNHASYADSLALIARIPLDFLFVAKRELRSWPFIGAIIRKGRHLTVERLDTAQSVADAARAVDSLKRGEIVLFFPEGTFTRATGLRPFKMGAFEAAVATGAPVVPIALRGTRHVLASGRHVPRPGRISLWIGEPLTPPADGWRAALELRDRTASDIAAHCGEPRLDLVVGGVERPDVTSATR